MRDKILRMELYGKFEDESLIKEVLASFPVRVENTLNYYRTKLLGKVPEDRDSYDPAPILSTEDGGDKVTLDSNDLLSDSSDVKMLRTQLDIPDDRQAPKIINSKF